MNDKEIENPLKDVFFPVKDDIIYSVGKRTPEGVSNGDACGIDHGKLCEALLRAGIETNYSAIPIEGYSNSFVQLVNPILTKDKRAWGVIVKYDVDSQGNTASLYARNFHGIYVGGLPNLDTMLSQYPNGWDYTVEGMKKARAVPGRSNFVWGHPEAVEDQGINLSGGYTWQDMVAGKNSTGPWNWTLLKVFPSGDVREIFKVDEVPSSLIYDAVFISVGKGFNPYNSDNYACAIVGGRGGSTAFGGMIFDRSEALKLVKGSALILKEIDDIVENRPDSTQGIQLVVTDWLEKGKPVKAGEVIAVNYI